MNTSVSARHGARRDDILVSVCFSELAPSTAEFSAVVALADRLDAHYRFREIVVVADAENLEAYLPLVKTVPNLRLFTVRSGLSTYRKRVIAASEAIGDVVLLTRAEELVSLDCFEMIEQAAGEGRVIVALRAEPNSLNKTLSSPLIALGRAAGFKVGLLDMQTVALPRTLLNQILDHSEPDLALRFPPRDPRIPLGFVTARSIKTPERECGRLASRLVLIQKLMVYVAPRILFAVTLASGLLAFLGVGYAVYVIGAWVFLSEIEPGWLTTSIMLSLTASFLGISIFGLSVGLQHLLALLRRNNLDSVAQEINSIDLFGQVASELNVDIDRSQSDQPKIRA